MLWLLVLWVSGAVMGIAIHRAWANLSRPRFGPYWVCFADGQSRKEVRTADEAIALQRPGDIIMVSVSPAYVEFKERTQSKYGHGPAPDEPHAAL
jgi:hypothetical protein